MSTQDNPILPFEPGELIAGKYRVDRLLGAGGMGLVVAATHLDLNRPVAVKLIRAELAQDPSVVERLMLEARAAAQIKSDHVGKVLDVGKLPSGIPYIVMEFLEGVDLCQHLERHGALQIIEAVDTLLQACEAVAEAHQANIVHRDLKPENLFVARYPDGSPNIKVLDFGVSKQLGDPGRRALTNPSSAVGSPQYMAPEQMQAGTVDVRVDIWALGAILYELLSNRQAFEGSTIPEVCVKVLGHEPIPLSEHVPYVPDGLLEIVNRCLSKAPDKRYSSVAELVEHLAPFGSERAGQSLDRIRGVVAGRSGAIPGLAQVRPGSAATMVATTPGGGMAVSVAKTEQWPANTSGAAARAATRWPVFAGMLGVIGLGAGLWFFSTPGADEMVAEPEKTSQPAVAPPPVTEAPPTTAINTSPTATNAASPAAEPSVSPVVGEPVAAPTSNPAASVAAPQPRPRPQRKAPKSNPWDTDNFGGRR